MLRLIFTAPLDLIVCKLIFWTIVNIASPRWVSCRRDPHFASLSQNIFVQPKVVIGSSSNISVSLLQFMPLNWDPQTYTEILNTPLVYSHVAVPHAQWPWVSIEAATIRSHLSLLMPSIIRYCAQHDHIHISLHCKCKDFSYPLPSIFC